MTFRKHVSVSDSQNHFILFICIKLMNDFRAGDIRRFLESRSRRFKYNLDAKLHYSKYHANAILDPVKYFNVSMCITLASNSCLDRSKAP